MTYVYMLSDHGEYGAENVQITLDRGKLLDMLDKGWGDMDCGAEARGKLYDLLAQTDDELVKHGGTNLVTGWGGPQLHVVVLT